MKWLAAALLGGAAMVALNGCSAMYGQPYYAMGPGVYGATYYGAYGYHNYYYGGGYRPWRGAGWYRGGGWYHGGWRR